MADDPVSFRDRLNKALAYDPSTGEFRWKSRSNMSVQWNGRYAGKLAGHLSASNGYVSIRFEDRGYLAHQLAWMIVHGHLPTRSIDHINRDKTDNRIANLRLASLAENNRNTPMRRDNTSGIKGVSRHRRTGKWMAMISIAGQRKYLGLFESKEEAAKAYAAAGAKFHGDFFTTGKD